MESYYPKKGEIIWCDLDPVAGHEQAGLRPCVVISASLFNKKTGRAIICPMTTAKKDEYYYRMEIDAGKVKGYVMIDQIRAVDWTKRFVRSSGALPTSVLSEMRRRLLGILEG